MPANQVIALFNASTLSFNLEKGATFADLAACLDRLGEPHDGKPTAVFLKLCPNVSRASGISSHA